jgi:broad specificity phosphatase PhoE
MLCCAGFCRGNTVKQLYVVRHGRTEWNEARRMQGQLDSPLTDAGRGHARQHGALLSREGAQRLIVSTLGRTRETAEIAGTALEAPVEFDARLMERDFGEWGGLLVKDVERQFPEGWTQWRRDPYNFRPPGGENLPDMLRRVTPLLESLPGLPESKVALVSHGGMARVILTHFLGLTPDEAIQVAQPNDLVYRLDFSSARVDCCFFRAGQGPTPGTFSRP